MKAVLSFPGCHRRGGVERIVYECARYLAGLGHQVDVFANEWEVDPSQDIRYHAVTYPKHPYFLRPTFYFRACTDRLKSKSFDVLNTHGCVCPVGGVHWAQSLHRAWLEQSRQFRRAFSVPGIKQRLNPLHLVLLQLEARHFRERSYRKVIATTPQVRSDLNRHYGVPETDVKIIPNGFSPEEFSTEKRLSLRNSQRDQLGLKPHEIVLLFVANELERKGYATILDAMRRLQHPDLRLLVVGRAKSQEIRKLAAQAGLEDVVRDCGSTSDVSKYHAAADVFVLPTQYEAFCLAILEALGSGLPVVTTCVPGARDAIQPGINGALIDDPKSGIQLADALEPLLERNVREQMSSQAGETVRAYQWPIVLRQYEAVLQECIG